MAERNNISERGIPRRKFLKETGLTAASSIIAAAGMGLKPVSAETPTPTPNPLDVEIEKAREELAQMQRDKPKRERLEGLRAQIQAELNPQKTPTPDSRDPQIAALQKQLTDTQSRLADNQKQFEDFRRTLSSDPTVKVFTDEQLKKYIDSGVETKLKAKEAEEAAQKAADAAQRAKNFQESAADREEAQRIKAVAAEDSKREIDTAKVQAAAMKGKVELPVVGEVPDKVAIGGAAVAGGLLGRWLRPIKWGRGAIGFIRNIRGGGGTDGGGGVAPGGGTPPAPAGEAVQQDGQQDEPGTIDAEFTVLPPDEEAGGAAGEGIVAPGP
ncbi:hypothetical protein M1437_00480 [Patescibacteria group bacterium]|nr:hypothetical protein [Patescibacteria group bacterium]